MKLKDYTRIKKEIYFFIILSILLALSITCSRKNNGHLETDRFFQESYCNKQGTPRSTDRETVTLKQIDSYTSPVLTITTAGKNKEIGFTVRLCSPSLNSITRVSPELLEQSRYRLNIPTNDKHTHINEILIEWDDNHSIRLFNVPITQILTIKHPENNPAYGIELLPALRRALEYAQHAELQPIEILMLDRLISNYSLKNQRDTQKSYLTYVDNAVNEKLKQQLQVAQRVMDASIVSSKEAVFSTPWPDIIIFSALHCDRIPLPEDTSELWHSELQKGGYPATHILLAYKWAKDNKCTIKDLPENFADLATDIVIAQVDSSDGLNDMEIEAMCWVAMLDQEEKIKSEWLKSMLEQQKDDGGWPVKPDINQSNPHTSGLAAWLLLDLHFYNQSFGSHIDIQENGHASNAKNEQPVLN